METLYNSASKKFYHHFCVNSIKIGFSILLILYSHSSCFAQNLTLKYAKKFGLKEAKLYSSSKYWIEVPSKQVWLVINKETVKEHKNVFDTILVVGKSIDYFSFRRVLDEKVAGSIFGSFLQLAKCHNSFNDSGGEGYLHVKSFTTYLGGAKAVFVIDTNFPDKYVVYVFSGYCDY